MWSAGRIRRGEIVGIIGANALGKTTFMRMLAGVDKPDSGKIDVGATISYSRRTLTKRTMVTYGHCWIWQIQPQSKDHL